VGEGGRGLKNVALFGAPPFSVEPKKQKAKVLFLIENLELLHTKYSNLHGLKKQHDLVVLFKTQNSKPYSRHTHKKTQRTDKKTDKPDGKPVLCQKIFSSVFRAVFFTQLNRTV